ncbi:MAG: hypothetical protein JWO77_240 [Ilumatobacteraceae bacterium]|nr:hypothetical protein [Ilumatobacteraceae bacterium]
MILVARAESKTWWRNFRTDWALDVLIAGTWCPMTGRAVEGTTDDEALASLLETYLARFPRAESSLPGNTLAVQARSAVIVACEPRATDPPVVDRVEPERLGSEPTSTPPVFRMRWVDRVGDTLFRGLARLGVGPASVLTTTGRRTGIARRTPVIPVRQGDRRWLVAPYGDVGWVLNARAAGQVELRHGHDVSTARIREVTAVEAGPVLKQYVAVASATRPYFRAEKTAPISEFIAEAHLHPVFELTAC